jgi:hypothetical protein
MDSPAFFEIPAQVMPIGQLKSFISSSVNFSKDSMMT